MALNLYFILRLPVTCLSCSLQALSPHEAAALLLVMLGQLPKALVPNIAILLIEAAIEAGQVGPETSTDP